MKKIILDDRKQYLPNLIMVLMSLVFLEIVIVIGFLSKNTSLVSTLLGICAITMLINTAIMISMAGKVWLKDLRNTGIWKVRQNEGMTVRKTAYCKEILYAAMLFLSVMLYGLVLVLDIIWRRNALPLADDDQTEKEFAVFTDNFFHPSLKNFVLILEFLMVAVAAVALVFVCVTLVYNGLTRNRYAGILAGVLYVSVGYFLIRLSLTIIHGVKGEIRQSLAGSAIMLIVSGICLEIVTQSVKKHQCAEE
ncbi:MAG: hypothetical protein J5643_03665 [Lachnospiraceae bacterium]|nr:hypothetical protein [Lachnospiraceae bacterium]